MAKSFAWHEFYRKYLAIWDNKWIKISRKFSIIEDLPHVIIAAWLDIQQNNITYMIRLISERVNSLKSADGECLSLYLA